MRKTEGSKQPRASYVQSGAVAEMKPGPKRSKQVSDATMRDVIDSAIPSLAKRYLAERANSRREKVA